MTNKQISVEEIEQNPDRLDEVMDDCHANNTVYDIYQNGELKCKMIPYSEYCKMISPEECEEIQSLLKNSD